MSAQVLFEAYPPVRQEEPPRACCGRPFAVHHLLEQKDLPPVNVPLHVIITGYIERHPGVDTWMSFVEIQPLEGRLINGVNFPLDGTPFGGVLYEARMGASVK